MMPKKKLWQFYKQVTEMSFSQQKWPTVMWMHKCHVFIGLTSICLSVWGMNDPLFSYS